MRSSLIIFENLDEDDVAWIHQACRKASFAAGTTLVECGRANRKISLLLQGRCQVFAADGRLLDTLSPGDMMGEISFVDRRKTTARICAETDVVVAVLEEDVLQEKLQSDTAFAARFYMAVASVLAFRLRRNLQVAISADADVLNSSQEFAGEIDVVDLDSTAKAGARLSYLLAHLL
ncbi:cyclic nucleotide-binding domain-containing protein [Rhodoferax aquaticus]|uniref:Cyclic nucleotide-binding domain-containing protein n=1 Tax=Rhodoferax aquaticus TaxID=2527691 RepID=A0A515EKK0_9BURK|nr:cyclic nucleotide-binding domain-containing protein [Rhodoferax aquaticus]QDL53176.1 cyclic nucleotide-binding domain-containing protein [Rhodoferax aquaticus]